MTYNFPPWGGGDSIRVRKMVKYFLRMGWEVHVLTIDESYIDPDAPRDTLTMDEVKDCIIHRTKSLEPSSEKKEAIRNASGIARDGTVVKKKGLFGGLLSLARKKLEPFILVPDYTVLWAPYAVAAGRKIAKDQGIDIIFANCPPFGTLIGAYFLAKKANMKLVLDIKDIWVGGPASSNMPVIRQKLDRFIERSIISRSDRTLFVTPAAHAMYASRYPGLAKRFSLVPNGVDLEDFQEAKKHSDPCFKVLIPGMLNAERNPISVIAVFEQMIKSKKIDPDSKLQLLGDIYGLYIEMGKKILGANFEYIPAVSHEKYRRYLFNASALVIISTPSIPSSIPGKLYEAISASRRFIHLPAFTAGAKLCRRYGYGTVADFDDKDEIASFLREAYDAFKRGDTVSIVPEELLANFSRKHLAEKISNLISQL